jgi:prephenate dehydrogenase
MVPTAYLLKTPASIIIQNSSAKPCLDPHRHRGVFLSRNVRRCTFDAGIKLEQTTIAIVGLGLMGGSLAKALKQRSLTSQVVGVARRSETIQQAEATGVIDWGTTDLETGAAAADIIVLATPVRTIIQQLTHLASIHTRPSLVIDLGSTKAEIVHTMNTLPDQFQVLGTHPMCGKETRGLEVADADLYVGAPWILVPLERTTGESLRLVERLVLGVGAFPIEMQADRHDHLVAAISHLPYALAASLVLTAASVGDADPMMWQLAAGGFRDTSRVAASDVTMMIDILLTNREAVSDLLQQTAGALHQLASLLSAGDEISLREKLQAAQSLRSGLNE